MLKEILAVFIGGGLGSSLRYLISKAYFISNSNFPYSTFISNALGCILLGILVGYFIKQDAYQSTVFLFLTVGFCGGFTTFSSFSYESLELIQSGQTLTFFTYLFLSFFTGITGLYFGTILFKSL